MRGVFIGRRFDDPWFILPVGVSVLGLFAGAWFLAISQHPPDGFIFYVWAIVAAFAIGRTVWIAADRRCLVPTAHGLTIIGRSRDQLIPDDAITAIGFWNRTHYKCGTPRHQLVTVELTMSGRRQAERVEFVYRYDLNDADPLGYWRMALIERLEQEAARDITAGGTFAADHWSLDRHGLNWFDRGRQRHIPVEEIAHATTADGAFCVWRGEDERPAFRLKRGAANAMVLWGLLARMMPEQPAGEPRVADGLGRVLCDRNTAGSPDTLKMVYGFTAFLLLLGTGGVLFGLMNTEPHRAAIVLGLLSISSGVSILLIIFLVSGTISLHTNGVSMRTRFGTRRIRLPDLCGMTWTETNSHFHGVYTGTSTVARLKSFDGTVIRFRLDVNNVDFDLHQFRDEATTHIARRLQRFVARGRRVPWFERLSFGPDGLVVASRFRWLGGRERVLPYSALSWEFKGTGLKLCNNGRAVVDLNGSADNFLPGLALLKLLQHEPMPAGGFERS